MTKLLLLVFSLFTLYAFELPTVEIKPTTKPEIIIFKVESIIVNNHPSYKLLWKTKNATKVQINKTKDLKPSGSVVITQGEYNRGEITLKASNKNSEHIATQTINSNASQNKSTPMIQENEQDNFSQQQFYNRRYPGGIRNPMNTRRRRY